MAGRKTTTVANRILWVFGLLAFVSNTVNAERLPVRIYTTADGLGHNNVNRIVPDSRGFMWFCTSEGLSRFDGYGFTNYGIDQGLPSAIVNDLLETREGTYWVATAGGLCRFDPQGRSRAGANIVGGREAVNAMFTVYFPAEDARSEHVTSLLQDRAGFVWCGTYNGLYRVETEADEVNITYVDLGIPDYFESRLIQCLLEDRQGTLWVGASGLYRRWPDGRVEAYTSRDGLPDPNIHSLLEDREGRIWAGTALGGLCRLVSNPTPGRNVVARIYSGNDGLTTSWINQLFQASDGGLWAGSNFGLIQFIPTADGRDFRFRVYAEAHGLSYHEVASVAEDRNGNLWVGMLNGGAAKIARSGFTTFGKADGFFWAASILETKAGDILAVGGTQPREWLINRFDGERFIPIHLRFLESSGYITWGWNQTVLEDHTGEWWVGTRFGVFRFPRVSKPEQLANRSPKAVYTTRDRLTANVILRLFEDSRGDIWIGSVGEGAGLNGLLRWERGTGNFHHYTEKDNLPRLDTFYVSSFAEDRAGDLWIGFSGDGGLVRYGDGRFTLFTVNDGLPHGQIRNLLVDSVGRLWVPSYRGGLSRMDEPAAERPRLITYTTADGLSSNEITAVSEDQWGRIYIANGRGIDMLDVRTGHIKHYTTADGLPLGEMMAALSDRKGTLWFSFSTGLARLVPEPDPQPVPPPILITGLRIAGEPQTISALGQSEIAPLKLSALKNELQIDFVALGFSLGEALRYQYKLEGTDQDWSQPSNLRTVNFASLAPGAYRFLVRAVNADGVLSETPAACSFTILPPVWRRWWFLTIAALLVAAASYAAYRYRVRRLLELERVRTRIAADLHDDIGSNLTRIAILSEVAHSQLNELNPKVESPLSSIAQISRESVASMSDIVWAINPKRDSLLDLVQRMRRFASELFATRKIEFQFRAPETEQDLKLGADVRRDVFLIFKEAVNNASRHSGCENVEIELRLDGSWLVLEVNDDGRGFDVNRSSEGQGLVSMRRRASRLGGELQVSSQISEGTEIALKVPRRSR